MRLFFVGIHNKPNTPPLCPSTKSGKLISRIVYGVQSRYLGCEVFRTNLYNQESMPIEKSEKMSWAEVWWDRWRPEKSDVIVLLGAEVGDNFLPKYERIVQIYHPASRRSHKQMDDYVRDSVKKIGGEFINRFCNREGGKEKEA